MVALDANIQDSNVNSTEVRLFDASGTTLASATVSKSDPVETAGSVSYYTHVISSVTLAANTTYYIVQDASSTAAYDANVTSVAMAGGLTYGAGVAAAGTGQNPTSDSLGGSSFANKYFGPNFNIRAVPEPSALVQLSLAGAIALGLSWRKIRR